MNAVLPRIASTLPTSLKNKLRPYRSRAQRLQYSNRLRRLGLSRDEILILATITKTGTHLTRFMIANYAKLLADAGAKPVEPTEIDSLLPNGWHHAYLPPYEYKKPTTLLAALNLHDVPRSHISYQDGFWAGSRVLHLYRNPLDFAVALYFFKYEYDSQLVGTMAGPAEVLDIHLDEFMASYNSFRHAARKGARLLSFSYEDLLMAPDACLNTVIRWLGLEPKQDLVQIAVRYSFRIKAALIGAGEAWQRDGRRPANPRIDQMVEQFWREGSVGQWRAYFSADQVRSVRDRLEREEIDLDTFVLDSSR